MQTILNYFTRHRIKLSVLAAIVCVIVLALGARRAGQFTVPMYQGEYAYAAESEVAPPVRAFYDAGLQAYLAEDYTPAKEHLSKAYSALSSKSGQIDPSEDLIASDIQFLLALTHERTKQKFMAIEAYKQALRHNPDHMAAKYNLERLLLERGGSSGAGAGPGDTSAPGGKAGKDGKKGI